MIEDVSVHCTRETALPHLLIEHEATEQGRALLRREVVEHAVEDHLRKKQLVARTNLARHTSLLLDDVLGRREAQSSERTLAALELVEVHDAVRRLNLLLDGANLGLDFLLRGVLVVESGELGVVMEGVGEEAGFEDLDFLCAILLAAILGRRARTTHAEELLERIVDDTHVLDRIEKRDSIREPSSHLLHALERLLPRLRGLEVLGEKDANVADSVEGGEKDGDDGELAFLAGRAGTNTGRGGGRTLLLNRRSGTGCAVQEDVDDVLALRSFGRGERLALRETKA